MLDSFSTARQQFAASCVIEHDPFNRDGYRLGLTRIEEFSGFSNDFRDRSAIAADHRAIAAHGLEGRDAESFVQRGIHQRGRSAVVRREQGIITRLLPDAIAGQGEVPHHIEFGSRECTAPEADDVERFPKSARCPVCAKQPGKILVAATITDE
jgi:hypothetical protein